MNFKYTVWSILVSMLIFSCMPAHADWDMIKKTAGCMVFFGTCAAVYKTAKWLHTTLITSPQCKWYYEQLHKNTQGIIGDLQKAHKDALTLEENITSHQQNLGTLTHEIQGAQGQAQNLHGGIQEVEQMLNQGIQQVQAAQNVQKNVGENLKGLSTTVRKNESAVGSIEKNFPLLFKQLQRQNQIRMRNLLFIKRKFDTIGQHLNNTSSYLDQAMHEKLPQAQRDIKDAEQVVKQKFARMQELLKAETKKPSVIQQHLQDSSRKDYQCAVPPERLATGG